MRRPGLILTALSLAVLGIYLFVTAPPALPEASAEPLGVVPIEQVLQTVAAENDIVRALYTAEIVTKGTEAGLLYDEDWRDEGVDAGPLPALFLREAARSLQANPLPVGLFLGSDFPISPANRFEGAQAEVFERIKQNREPEYFYAEDTGQYTAMFPDVAGVAGCVSCHNDHVDSPKTDWQLDDVMGAATWSYTKPAVSQAEYLRIVAAVRQSFRDAYARYVEKTSTFESQPELGERWPEQGFYLPSVDVFMEEFGRRASAATVERLLVEADSVAT
ncbi:MAG: DUF3365 domain-containing protein [Gemmatimonadota bacterium]